MRQATREKHKPLIAFTKKYFQEHYYFNSRKLAKVYGNHYYEDKPPISLVKSFARILSDLRELGVIERFNKRQYRKVISQIKRD